MIINNQDENKEVKTSANQLGDNKEGGSKMIGIRKTPKRRARLGGAFVLILVVLALVGITPMVANVLAQTTLSPLEYYKSIEKANSDKQIDALSKGYGEYLANINKINKNGMGTEVSIKATLDSSITAPMDLKGLNSIKANIVSMQSDKKSKSTASLFINDVKFTSMDLFTDTKKELAYILIPELSKAYLKLSTKTDYNELLGLPELFSSQDLTTLLYDNPLSEKQLNQLLKKYADIIIAEVNNIEESKQDKLMAGDVTINATKITVKLDEKTAQAIAEEVLTTAKNDKELLDLCVKLKICTKKQYIENLQKALDDLKKSKTTITSEEEIIMIVWIDSKGSIIGREFSTVSGLEKTSMGYKTVKDGSKVGVEAWFVEDKIQAVKMVGNFSTGTKGLTGVMNITSADKVAKTSESFSVKLENVKYTANKSNPFINGNITITGKSLSGMSIVANCIGDTKSQNINMKFVQDKVNLITLAIDAKTKTYKEFSLPSKNAKLYDAEKQMDKYLKGADLNKYLKTINKKIKVKGINNLINELMSQ